jgi:hypothetical protein
MRIADLNSRAQIVIVAARKELRPAVGERERLEALVNARISATGLDSQRPCPPLSPP